MSPPSTPPDFNPVMALSDGEAAPGALAPTGEALAAQLRHQAQLRRALGQAAGSGPCPEALRAQIRAMLAQGGAAGATAEATAGASPGAPIAGKIGAPAATHGAFAPRRWHKFALVASLMLVSSLGYVAGQQGWHPPIGQSALAEDVLADKLATRNELCSEHTELVQGLSLMGAQDAVPMPALVLQKTGRAIPFSLDLGPLGYGHCLVGACTVPGPDSAHLLYRNDAGSTLSVWIRKDDGRVPTEPGRVRVTLLPKHHKVVASWRDATGIEYHAVAPSLVELRRLLVWMGCAMDEKP